MAAQITSKICVALRRTTVAYVLLSDITFCSYSYIGANKKKYRFQLAN